jgi:hypothetical protein
MGRCLNSLTYMSYDASSPGNYNVTNDTSTDEHCFLGEGRAGRRDHG